jgi:hypothetical protein
MSRRRGAYFGWNILGLDDAPGCEDDHGLDEILELANISRPLVAHEQRHGFRRNRYFGTVMLLARMSDEGFNEQGDVGFAIAQRRQIDV